VRYWCFGAFVLDSLRGVLLRNGETVPLTPRVFQLLSALVERHGRVLGKDELLHLVWHDAIVEENNLPRSISTLRKALGERPGQCDYIVTLPGVGYRFVAEVHGTDEVPAFAHDASATAIPDVPVDPRAVEAPASSDLKTVQSHALVASEPSVSVPIVNDGSVYVCDTPADAIAPDIVPADTDASAGRGRRRPMRVAWLLPVGLLLILTAGASAWRGLPSWRVSAKPRALWQFTTGTGVQRQPAWSPDGSAVAYASNRDGNSDIWVQPLAGGEPMRITASPEYDGQPAWSPTASGSCSDPNTAAAACSSSPRTAENRVAWRRSAFTRSGRRPAISSCFPRRRPTRPRRSACFSSTPPAGRRARSQSASTCIR
jgi:DNA-binding winged helix-turn-helix (wHTH) protein